MSLLDNQSLIESASTRRSIVKTGVKLAYAAPLVAASMKVSAGGAGAVSNAGNQCLPDSGETCGPYASCGETSSGNPCVCVRAASGSTVCSAYGLCVGGTPCDTDEECGDVTGYFGETAPGYCHVFAPDCCDKQGKRGLCAPLCQ